MMSKLSFLLSTILIILTSTAKASTMGPSDTTIQVILYNLKDSIPPGATIIDDFKIGDKGFTTDCQYQRVIEKAKEKAAQAGGNAIKITELKEPDIWSTCYRIKGKILKITSEEYSTISAKKSAELDAEEPIIADSSSDYAIIYLYRPKNFSGSAIGYNVYLDDSIICRITNNSKYEIKVYKEGEHKIWAKTEAKAIVPLNIKRGNSYFIKCGIQMGLWVGQPSMNLIYPTQGKEEYAVVKGKNKKD